MLSKDKKKILIRGLVISGIAMIFLIITFIMLKYEVEGETKMPFKLTKISTISTANGIPNEETEDVWNFNLVQNNDIYFTFERTTAAHNIYIERIAMENITVLSKPAKGETYFYGPSKEAVDWYDNNPIYRVKNTIEYAGETESNIKELKVGNQGGIVGIRYSIENLGTYISQEDQIKHDGELLKVIGVEETDLISEIEFDLVIELSTGIKYKAKILKTLPMAEVLEEGISKSEDIELKKITFKRF